VCTSDLDCPTTDADIYASCKCGHNAKGLKYCDIAGGDTEWVNAFTAVIHIYLSSTNEPYQFIAYSSVPTIQVPLTVTHQKDSVLVTITSITKLTCVLT
jgi:hypothetical protein